MFRRVPVFLGCTEVECPPAGGPRDKDNRYKRYCLVTVANNDHHNTRKEVIHLTLEQYHELAFRTAREKEPGDRALMVAALGLAGESGEFAEIVKKHLFHDHPLDRDKAIKEVGDVLWYVSQACTALGVSLEEVGQMNIDKLRKRYPEGFTPERSIHRSI